MPFTVVLFAWRKPGLTPTQFKDHYENVHMPLVQAIGGNKFPITHTRHYIQRIPSSQVAPNDTSNAAHPAVVMGGEQKDFDYDSYAEIVFEDEASFQAFYAIVTEEDNAKKIDEDEQKFLDRKKMIFAKVDDVRVTSRLTQ